MRLSLYLLVASLAWAADPAFVQSKSNFANGVFATIAATFTSNVVSGNVIAVAVGYDITAQTVTIADSVGTTYVQKVAPHFTTTNQAIELWCGVAAGSGANTVTATSGASNFFIPFISIHEYSATTCTTDGTGSNDALTAAGSVNLASSAITTTQAKDVLFAASYGGGAGGSWTAGTNYTLRESSAGFAAYGSEDFLTTTTVTDSCPITPNANTRWTGECMALKPSVVAKRRAWIGD